MTHIIEEVFISTVVKPKSHSTNGEQVWPAFDQT